MHLYGRQTGGGVVFVGPGRAHRREAKRSHRWAARDCKRTKNSWQIQTTRRQRSRTRLSVNRGPSRRQMEGEQKIADEYPLHYQVWNNDAAALANSAAPDSGHLEQLDPRGRTPLMLAVTFGYVDCARVLIQAGANVNVENSGGWTGMWYCDVVENGMLAGRWNRCWFLSPRPGFVVVQEASATGIPELLQLVLEKRDHQRHNNRMLGVPALLHQLREVTYSSAPFNLIKHDRISCSLERLHKNLLCFFSFHPSSQAPDFYMEMKWEFTSWRMNLIRNSGWWAGSDLISVAVPLVSRLCPSDTYKVYKQGSKVRIDTTLLGFDQNSWQRGNKSYIFRGESESVFSCRTEIPSRSTRFRFFLRSGSAQDLMGPTQLCLPVASGYRITPGPIPYWPTIEIS